MEQQSLTIHNNINNWLLFMNFPIHTHTDNVFYKIFLYFSKYRPKSVSEQHRSRQILI